MMPWWQYLLTLAIGLLAGWFVSLAWRGTGAAASYWARVFFGSLNAGVIAATGVLIGGSSLPEGGQLQVSFTRGTVLIAVVWGLAAMAKDMQTYLKIPGPPPNGGTK